MNTFQLSSLVKNALLSILIFLGSFTAIAQEEIVEDEPTSLNERYDKLMEKASNYQQYKVIKETQIVELWASVNDTLNDKTDEVSSLKSSLVGSKSQIDSLKVKLNQANIELENSEESNATISFFGADLNKGTYHALVWGIIILLIAGCAGLYLMFLGSNSHTSRLKRDNEFLRNELEDFKDKSRETQVRLKRELQTAVNALEDIKRGGSQRR
ncbi:MAG: hypothetical protein ACI83W_002636 [Marinoscillum sp.]|jgi:hypothetical protein